MTQQYWRWENAPRSLVQVSLCEWHSTVQTMFYYGSAQTKATECQLWEFLSIRKVVTVLISGHAHAHGLHVKVLLRKQRLVIST